MVGHLASLWRARVLLLAANNDECWYSLGGESVMDQIGLVSFFFAGFSFWKHEEEVFHVNVKNNSR